MKSLTRFHIQTLLVLAIGAALCIFGMPHGDAAAIGLVVIGMTTAAPFPVNPTLQAITLAYKNNKLIADDVLPRAPVAAEDFRYKVYGKEQFLTITETRVGRKGSLNQIEFSGTEETASTNDEGLKDMIPISDIGKAADQGMPDPVNQAVEWLSKLVALRREQRVAAIVHGAGTYGAGNKIVLAGNDQWSDFVNSDPLTAIVGAMDGMFFRPNVAVMGQAVSSTLRRHPKIVKAYNGTAGDSGMVPLQFLADLFELDKILIGQAWANTAKKGQAASLARLWGKHFALLYQAPGANFQNPEPTFGLTAQYGMKFAGSKENSDIGLKGGIEVRAGEQVKELVFAKDLGYLFEDVIA